MLKFVSVTLTTMSGGALITAIAVGAGPAFYQETRPATPTVVQGAVIGQTAGLLVTSDRQVAIKRSIQRHRRGR